MIVFLLTIHGQALAAEPADIRYTPVQTSTLPFDFEPVTIGTPVHQIIPDFFADVSFINQVGSIALTVWEIVDTWSVIGILVVILLSLRFVWWLYGLVTEQSTSPAVNLSGGLSATADVTGDQTYDDLAQVTRKSTRLLKNPYK